MMLITIKSHKQIDSERVALLEEALELMKKQARSNAWYAKRMNSIRLKLIELEKQLGILK